MPGPPNTISHSGSTRVSLCGTGAEQPITSKPKIEVIKRILNPVVEPLLYYKSPLSASKYLAKVNQTFQDSGDTDFSGFYPRLKWT